MRHGETMGAEPGKLYGQTDVALSAQGIEQSRRLAEHLVTKNLAAVYSSDLQRASAGAEMIAACHHLDVHYSSAWREINMGKWECKCIAELNEAEPDRVAELFNDPASFQYPGGESFAVFINRIHRELRQLLARHDNGEVALVTHAGVCRVIIGQALHMPAAVWLRLAQAAGCLNVIDWRDSYPVLEAMNHRDF